MIFEHQPKVDIENRHAWREFYLGRRPNVRVARFAHWVMGKVYNPHYSFAPGAEEAIGQIPSSARKMIVANHSTNHDPNIIAAAVQQVEVLNSMCGNGTIMSKPPLLRMFVLRRFFNSFGVFPGFRETDITKKDNSPIDPLLQAKQREAADFGIEIGVEHLDHGEDMGLFPEGKRNKRDPTRLQKLKRGLGRMVCGTTADVRIIPMGIYNKFDPTDSKFKQLLAHRRPYVYIGIPIEGPFINEDLVTERVSWAMADALCGAVAAGQPPSTETPVLT